MNRSRRFLSAGILSLFLFSFSNLSCHALRGPQGAGPLRLEQVSEILQQLRVRQSKLMRLRGLASIHYGSRLFGASSEAIVLLRRPSELRIDGLSPFGFYDYQVLISSGNLTVFWNQKNRFVKGLASRDLLAQYLSISLDPERAIEILAGVLPFEEATAYRVKNRKSGEIILKGDVTELELTRDLGGYVPVRFRQSDVDGSTLYEVFYGRWEEERGILFPREIRAEFREPRAKVEVRFLTLEPNAPLERGDFQISLPKDAEPL